MPLPLVFLLPPAAAGAGWAAGKVAKFVGDNFLADAKRLTETANQFSLKCMSEYDDVRRKMLERMSTYLLWIKQLAGAQADFDSTDIGMMPDDLKKSWERIVASHGFKSPFQSHASIARLDQQSVSGMRVGLTLHRNNHPILGAAALAMAGAKKGVEYSIECKKHKTAVQAWASATKAAAAAQVDTIKKDFEEMERDWDGLITPMMRAGLGPPRNEYKLRNVRCWAQTLDAKAKEMMVQNNEPTC